MVHSKYCKHLGSDRPDIIFAVFYSLTEKCFLNVPPKLSSDVHKIFFAGVRNSSATCLPWFLENLWNEGLKICQCKKSNFVSSWTQWFQSVLRVHCLLMAGNAFSLQYVQHLKFSVFFRFQSKVNKISFHVNTFRSILQRKSLTFLMSSAEPGSLFEICQPTKI